MIVFRCDVCRAEFTDAAKIVRPQARLLLFALADSETAIVELDVCESKACRATALKQLSEAVLSRAMSLAHLEGVTLAPAAK